MTIIETPNFAWHIYLSMTVTFTRMVATGVIIAGILYAYMFREPTIALGLVGFGVSLLVGRSAVDKMGNANPLSNLLPEHEVIIRKPQPKNVVECDSK